jgi:predicted dinucleotide-binding enzyme
MSGALELHKIGIVGIGNVGGTLGVQLARAGYPVVFGERQPGSDKLAKLLESSPKAQALPQQDLAAQVDLLIFATPWEATEAAVKSVGDLQGKIVVDATNPIKMGGPEELALGLLLGHTTSAAETIASWAPGARVVKCFNTIGAVNFANPVFQGTAASMLYCGDDPAAKKVVAQLAHSLGFQPKMPVT